MLGLAVPRVSLPRDHELYRALRMVQQAQRPLRVGQQQVQPLVGGHPPREAQREGVGVQQALGRGDELRGLASRRPVPDAAAADFRDQAVLQLDGGVAGIGMPVR